jgi:nucleoside permease NupC
MANRSKRAAEHNKASQQVWRKGALLMGFVGLLIFILGFVTLLLGQLHYKNYWGGAVFAPFALLIGVIAVAFAIRVRRRRD